jgi:Mrp family chromosome partitioning ATPase
MKHIEKALEVANEERARQRDRLRVIDAEVAAKPKKTRMQKAIEKARAAKDDIRPEVTPEPPVLTARVAPNRNSPPPKIPVDLTSIVYSETRVLNRPSQHLSRSRIVVGDGGDAVTRAYKLLRTQVLHRMAEKNWQTLAVVSPAASEGKTLTAINLGLALASSVQHTVMLVDCDWRKPSVHKYFDYEPEYDIATYLSGKEPLSTSLVNPGIPRFCFLPCKAPISQSSERLGSALVGSFVNELRERYRNRIVMFDLPPMLLTDDCLSFLPHVDCALVVVEEDRTDREELEQTLEMIGRDKLLGTVLNKSSVSLAEY